jgi:hypothetical protein
MMTGLAAGFLLDRQWHWLRGEIEQSKRPALLALARVLADVKIPYAIIGGVTHDARYRRCRHSTLYDSARGVDGVRLPFS